MFNEKTIDRIKTSIYVALGDQDFFTRKNLLEALKRAGLKLSNNQFTRDVQLLSQCQIKGFTHFKYYKGYAGINTGLQKADNSAQQQIEAIANSLKS